MSLLFVHCRRGLYQITKCSSCGYTWECQNCTAKLVAYRQTEKTLELLCHQCQTNYSYPQSCPQCSSKQVISKYGGIEELAEILARDFGKEIVRLDQNQPWPRELKNQKKLVGVTTRLFDPSLDYSLFEKIIFLQAENLLASPDYLVQEEANKQLAEVFLAAQKETEIIFDTQIPEMEFFQTLAKLNRKDAQNGQIQTWFGQFLEKEREIRQKMAFPPFVNLLLLTTQETQFAKSVEKLQSARNYLLQNKELADLRVGYPYPARFLKRRGKFSHHLLLRYPQQYAKFFQLKASVGWLAQTYNLQVRLNPRHLF